MMAKSMFKDINRAWWYCQRARILPRISGTVLKVQRNELDQLLRDNVHIKKRTKLVNGISLVYKS